MMPRPVPSGATLPKLDTTGARTRTASSASMNRSGSIIVTNSPDRRSSASSQPWMIRSGAFATSLIGTTRRYRSVSTTAYPRIARMRLSVSNASPRSYGFGSKKVSVPSTL